MIVVVPLMLCCLCSGFAFSLVALCLGARMKPVIGKNDLICYLGIGLFVFLWIVLVLPLFSTSVSANNLEDLPEIIAIFVSFGIYSFGRFALANSLRTWQKLMAKEALVKIFANECLSLGPRWSTYVGRSYARCRPRHDGLKFV